MKDERGAGEWWVWATDLIRLRLWRGLFDKTLLGQMRGSESIFEGERLQVETHHGAGYYRIRVSPVGKREWRDFEKGVNAGVLQSELYSSLRRQLARLPFLGGRFKKALPASASPAELKALGIAYTFSWVRL